jgi:ComF family protein
LIAVSDYCLPIKHFITRLKFYGEDKYAPLLARLMLFAWLDARRARQLSPLFRLSRPDLLLTVPLHHTRHWRRGFNQNDMIAKKLTHWVNCRYTPEVLVRARSTAVQRTLSAELRRYNLQGAFACNGDVRGLHIALLDDIVTTGNTVEEISQLLLSHGAASVQVWCLCRTLKSHNK